MADILADLPSLTHPSATSHSHSCTGPDVNIIEESVLKLGVEWHSQTWHVQVQARSISWSVATLVVFAREIVSASSFGSHTRAIPAETTAVAATVLHHFLALSEHSKSLLRGCLPYWSLYPSENTKAALSQSLVIPSLCFLFEETARSSA